MRIFKNRGDIYFSKINKKKSAEQKILIIALTAIVIFTVIFVVFLSVKYDFSAKKFFAPDNLKVSQVTDEGEEPLPKVSGKNNFITLVNNDENLLFVILTQVDMDNISYKVCTMKADTVCDGKSLKDIFKQSGAQNVKTAVESLLGADFDYYISMNNTQYADFFDELGDFYYPILSDIKFKSGNGDTDYSIRLEAGERKLNGSQVINLIRYYLDEENNSSLANDLVLNCLSQQINSDNLEKSEELFKLFITNTDTNITVRDFSLADDDLKVLSDYRTGASLYSARAEYENGSVSTESLKKIKGYFVK